MARSLEFLKGIPEGRVSLARQRLAARGVPWLARISWKTFERIIEATGPEDRSDPMPMLVGYLIAGAVLTGLRKQFPSDAERSDEALLRTYPDDALALLNQCAVRAAEALANHAERLFEMTPEQRLGFVMKAATAGSSRRGKKGLGVVRELHYLNLFEAAEGKIGDWFSRGQIYAGALREQIQRSKTAPESKAIVECLERRFVGKRIVASVVASTFVADEIAAAEEISPKLSRSTILRKVPAWRRLAAKLESLPPQPT